MNRTPFPSFLHRLRRSVAWQLTAVTLLVPGLVFLPATPSFANPSGGVVVQGAAEINADTLGHLMILQQSNRAVINWESFNIGPGEITEFIQPGTDAMALSRVTGGDMSAIYGQLKANGGHILVNTNGILVGPGGRVDVGGQNILSTLDIDDADFMAGGDMVFYGDTSAGVTNFGTITSAAGDVILMGNFVENNGSIGAVNGTVALAAGGEILVSSAGEATVSILRGGVGGETGVTNTGTINAASAELKAHGNIYALAVNNSGTIRATGVNREGGRVVLSAPGGTIRNSGTIEAVRADGTGGEILIDATGGNVELEGGEIRADGVGNGDGGSITVLGDTITADGGVEMSANGANGGTILIGGEGTTNVSIGNAVIEAIGNAGAGGLVSVVGTNVNLGAQSVVDASGTTAGGVVQLNGQTVNQEAGSMINTGGTAEGGSVLVDAEATAQISGDVSAIAGQGLGGLINVTADNVILGSNANLDASGTDGGGNINVGGGFQGADETLRNSNSTRVDVGAQLTADATETGDGGQVVVWSDNSTLYMGDTSASALGQIGNGGTVEISGAQDLRMWGSVAATSVNGRAGTVLFDPGDLTVGAAGTDVPVAYLNPILQGGTSVIVATHSGNITFADLGGGGRDYGGAEQTNQDIAVQWTNSRASFGAFASENIIIENHIRTSGGGSINLISGWTGTEEELSTLFTFTPDDAGSGGDPNNWQEFRGNVENIWEYYVENGQFGENNGSVILGNPGMQRHVEVGSRFGNTNVATGNLFMFASDTNTNPPGLNGGNQESRGVQLGFHDSGQVFAMRRNLNDGLDLDLNNRALETDDAPLVGIVGVGEVDLNNDGIVDGVHAINHQGILNSTNPDSGGDPTFIPYANLTNSSRAGNWWWQQIDAENPDPLGLGSLRPENGAGISDSQRADINVAATGSVIVQGGGRQQNYAQIGHGGDASGWGDNRAIRNGGIEQEQTPRYWSFNGSDNDRVATSIARLAPVYGNINILAGVDRDTVTYDRTLQTANLGGEVTGGGSITVQGLQRMGSANAPDNPEQNAASQAYAQIGHGGSGQSGSFFGDINVRAGGDVFVRSGGGTRQSAVIGHGANGYSYWDPPSNADAQVRIFRNADDFDNPNLRRGQLYKFADYTGTPGVDFVPINDQNPSATERSNPDFIIQDPRLIRQTQTNALGGAADTDTLVDGTGGAINSGDRVDLPKNATGNNTDTFVNPDTGVTEFVRPIVPELGGTVTKIYAGDINIEANGPTGLFVQAFETPDTSDPNFNYLLPENDNVPNGTVSIRDRRIAMVGHGGGSFAVWSEGNSAGFQTNRDDRNREIIQLRLLNDYSISSSLNGQETGTGLNRAPTWMTLQGDITVNANNGNVFVRAGNNQRDYAMIGHGGNELSDYETSGFINGDITIDAAGDLILHGGGSEQYTGHINNGNNKSEWRNWAKIGHGGFRSGFQSFSGDITINVGGDIDMLAGSTARAFAQIGHQSADDNGQTGGNFERFENFWNDSFSSDTTTVFNESGATITITEKKVEGGIGDSSIGNIGTDSNGIAFSDKTPTNVVSTDPTMTYTFSAAGGTFDDGVNGAVSNAYLRHSGNTADIDVNAGGDVTLRHLPAGPYQTDNELNVINNANNPGGPNNNPGGTDDYIDTRFSWALIGHGGRNVDAVREANPNYRFDDKVGNIGVNAGGDINMTSGNRVGRWTAIGHRGGNADANSRNRFGSPGMVFGGLITVTAGGDLIMDALGPENAINVIGPDERNFRNEYDAPDLSRPVDPTVSLAPSEVNSVNIGHGVSFNARNIHVVDGDNVNGIDVESDISIVVGNDMRLQGGSGYRASHAQVGHGFPDDQGNSTQNNLEGDITVVVGNNLDLIASPNAWVPNGTPVPLGINGAAAVIGHGGHFLDSPASGDIAVFVENDLTITGSQRRAAADDPNDINAQLPGSEGGAFDANGTPIGSYGNLAKIGHWSIENDVQLQPVTANHNGTIDVVVGNDLTMRGGRTENVAVEDAVGNSDLVDNMDEPIVFALSQIGHSGPGVEGQKTGNITVLVGNDVTTVDGTIAYETVGSFYDPQGGANALNYVIDGGTGERIRTLPNVNNSVQIGHGDWIRDGQNGNLPATGGGGNRSGDIIVSAGRNISLDHTLIGHADPGVKAEIATILAGSTTVQAGRDFPFWDGIDGDGQLRAYNDTVFSTAFYGGEQLRLYVADRESNLLGVEVLGDPTDTTLVGVDPNLNGVRMNDATAVYRGAAAGTPTTGGVSFANDLNVFDPSLGANAGDPDEIYLQPDLWWNDDMIATLFGVGDTFPETLADAPGGAIASVINPGGLPNLVALAIGDPIGSGTTDYSPLLGDYTIYYDAVQPVSTVPFFPPPPPLPPLPPEIIPPIIPPPPFNFFPFIFVDKYDSYDRWNKNLDEEFLSYLEGVGLVARFLRDEEGDPGVGYRYESELTESLAEILGFPVDETDEADEDRVRELEASRYSYLDGIYGIYYWVPLGSSEANVYTSGKVFGSIEGL